MKSEEIILNGKKIDIVVEIDQELKEENYIEDLKEDLEKTLDLSKTMEVIIGDKNENRGNS